ncbi:MAG: MerR family transcriptional regulator [Streptosporangiaceae bacterium]|nr:MerR family transcriptional regulator [Streptosporangiaceae bacterium]
MDTDPAMGAGLRIGEVARRTGMTVAALRAWETRHGLLAPARTAGGQRLYRETDIARVRAVQRLVARGWSVAGAVSQVLGQQRKREGVTGEMPAGTGEADDRHRPAARGRPVPGSERWPLIDALIGADPYAVLAAYETLRDLLRASRPSEVRDTLVGLVERLGGHVGLAAPQDDTVIPVDLAFGEGPPLVPRAPSPSVARMRLEAVLPLVVEDARVLVHRLRLSAPTGR